MAKLERIEALKAKMKKIAGQYANAEAAVGYTAAAAIMIHENLEMKWKGIPRNPRLRETKSGKHHANPRPRKTEPKGLFWDPQGKGQSKFLEAPARYLSKELGQIVARAMQKSRTMAQALLLAALRLGKESMLLVPVDTGNLKSSIWYSVNNGERVPFNGGTAVE